MNSLYLLSDKFLEILSLVILFGIMIQTLAMVYGFFRFCYIKRNVLWSLLEAGILINLFISMVIIQKVIYVKERGLSLNNIGNLDISRWITFTFLFIVCIAICIKEKIIFPISNILINLMTLPISEKIFGDSYCIVFIIGLGFWSLRAINCLYEYYNIRKNNLTAYSIKEAVDTMNIGLFFYRTNGNAPGSVVLYNNKMQGIMLRLTGEIQQNGLTLHNMLLTGDGIIDGNIEKQNSQIFYKFNDNTIWKINEYNIKIKRKSFSLIAITDATNLMKKTYELYDQKEKLNATNKQINEMLQNLEIICKKEEILRAKVWVHDIMSQRISLVLGAIREQKEPNEELLNSFADGFHNDFQKAIYYNNNSLNNLIKNFEQLGVTTKLLGDIPSNSNIKQVFEQIITEAMTNSVRHGHATKISVKNSENQENYILEITDNGKINGEKIIEGTGLREMRRKTENLGGIFSYKANPNFSINIQIPKGESND